MTLLAIFILGVMLGACLGIIVAGLMSVSDNED